MEISGYIEIGTIILLGSIIQSSSGFAFGLFAIPLLLFSGLNLPEAVVFVIVGSAIQKGVGLYHLRKFMKYRDIAPYLLVGLFSLPLGVYLMFKVSLLSQSIVKQIVGLCIMALLFVRWLGRGKTDKALSAGWGYVAGFFSGLLNGFANIGGPPIVLWILNQNWSNEKIRATLFGFSLAFVPVQILLILLIFGNYIFNTIWQAVLLSPMIFLGTWLGLKIGERIALNHLKIYMQLLLVLIALCAILKPLFD